MYQGHHPDGSGVQLHSAGALYPYSIAVRDFIDEETRAAGRRYEVLGPGAEFQCPTWGEAVSYASARKAEWSERNKPVKVQRPVIERKIPQVGLEAIVAGQHTVGVRERSGVKAYFVAGPRADEREFQTYAQAVSRIEYLESDLHSIELQFAKTQKAWSTWASQRNAAH